MFTLLLIQIILVVALVMIVLMQNPSVDSLAGLSNTVGSGNSITASANKMSFLSKLTYIIAALFIANNLIIMAVQSKNSSQQKAMIEQTIQKGEVPTDA